MRYNCTYKLVHDRKKQGGRQIIQIEVLFPARKRKYIGTGIKIPAENWDAVNRQIIGLPLAGKLNRELGDKITELQSFELDRINQGKPFTSDAIDTYLGSKSRRASFIQFAREQIEARPTTEGTKALRRHTIDLLEKSGIKSFDDLTLEGIIKFDRSIRDTHAQSTIHDYHVTIKSFIRHAIKLDIMPVHADPYIKFHSPKGHHKQRVRLDDTNIEKLIKAKMPTKILERSRDYYLFQLYTGVSYSDLLSLRVSNIKTNGNDRWLEGLRKKNHELFTAYLVPQAVELISKYSDGDKLFPLARLISRQNATLREVAKAAGIPRISTHTARHSFASLMIRRGVPVAVIQETLGHVNIATTMRYARMERQTIATEISRAFSS